MAVLAVLVACVDIEAMEAIESDEKAAQETEAVFTPKTTQPVEKDSQIETEQPAEDAAIPEEEAVAMPTVAPTANPSLPKKNGVCVTGDNELSMYDLVTFGSYPQGANGETQEIEWIVVGFDGKNRIKLLSLYALDTQKYHDVSDLVAWTSTSLYDWLNRFFKRNAFSQEEQKLLATDVTIPSVSEANDLPNQYRQCFSTPYAVAAGGNPTRCIWWLSDGAKRIQDYDDEGNVKHFCYASVVNERGQTAPGAIQTNFSGKVVRPLIILDLNENAAQERATAVLQRRGSVIRSISDLNLYDTVTFGRYAQFANGDASTIEWIVTGFNGNEVKLLSKCGLEVDKYHNANAMVTWKSSSLYDWLNGSFEASAFSPEEKQLLVGDVTIPTAAEAAALPSFCRVCLLTAHSYSDEMRKRQYIWWLSDPTDGIQIPGSSARSWCASAVSSEGTVLKTSYQVNYGNKMVRPMITLDLSKLPD